MIFLEMEKLEMSSILEMFNVEDSVNKAVAPGLEQLQIQKGNV